MGGGGASQGGHYSAVAVVAAAPRPGDGSYCCPEVASGASSAPSSGSGPGSSLQRARRCTRLPGRTSEGTRQLSTKTKQNRQEN